MYIKAVLQDKKELIDNELDEYLKIKQNIPDVIYKGMRYSVFAGGKRLRPILAMAGCEICGGQWNDVLPVACALEMIHTYSLIHDDLPAMDNDDYRRGKLTSHKVFGEAIAILAGDALLNMAFEIMLDAIGRDEKYLKAVQLVARSAGIEGMIGGQVIDLEYENQKVDLKVLKEMHNRKTGALINASILSGALIARCREKEYQNLNEFGNRLGLAFQIRDDILDVIGDEKLLGKKTGSDAVNKKSTYVTLLGLDKSRELVETLAEEAKTFLKIFGKRSAFLIELTNYLVNREY